MVTMSNVEFSLKRFPVNGKLKDECGLPFSCVIQPFSNSNTDKASHWTPDDGHLLNSAFLARCAECYSYINGYCLFHASGWECSLCGSNNTYQGHAFKRYSSDTRHTLPELSSNAIEVVVTDFDDAAGGMFSQVPVVGEVVPVVVALVDTCCEEECMELVRSSLQAALVALPPCTRFGLITVSNQIGLHDVRGPVPVLRSVPLLGPEAFLAASLEEVVPLEALLVPLGSHKEAVAQAIELLEPDESYCRTATPASTQSGPAPPEQEEMCRQRAGCRGFGRALQAVLEYLKSRAEAVDKSSNGGPAHLQHPAPTSSPALGPAHLLTFLSGPPDLGPGLVAHPSHGTVPSPHPPPHHAPMTPPEASAAGGTPPLPTPAAAPASPRGPGRAAPAAPSDPPAGEQEWRQAEEARVFYEQAAVAAVSLAVTVDIFAVGPQAVGVHLMAPLVASTGGCLFLYPTPEDSALPQDIYRRLAAPRALSCLLRVRTSPEFAVVRVYGRVFQDPTYPNLHHTPSCSPTDAFSMDFDFTSPVGFAAGDATPPTLQVAFQYSTLVQAPQLPTQGNGAHVPAPPGAHAPPPSPPPPRFVMQRRMKIITLRLYTAQTPRELYRGAQPEAVMALLCAKITKAMHAAADLEGGLVGGGWAAGVEEGRLLLRDWLIVFSADYHRHLHSGMPSLRDVAETPVDMTFPDCEALQSIPRLVYAMLRSPLLSPSPPPADLATFIAHLWSTLPPPDLMKAIYPSLSSYQDPDTLAQPQHPLSRAALEGAPGPILLLDAYILLICLYTSRCPPEAPYPPPQQSLIRKAIAQIRQERRVTPQLHMLREGVDDTALFQDLLLDEGVPGGPEGGGQMSLGVFLQHIGAEVQAHLRAEAAGKPQ